MTVKLKRGHFNGMGMRHRYVDNRRRYLLRDLFIIYSVISIPGFLAMALVDLLTGSTNFWVCVLGSVLVGGPIIILIRRGRQHLDEAFYQRCLREGVEVVPPDDENA